MIHTYFLEKEIELANGVRMPMIGFGTWGLLGNREEKILWALEAGYRHFDTSGVYESEEALSSAIRKSGIPRSELFVTTTLWNDDQGYASALDAIDKSLERLRVDYVDLYLIHWPYTHETYGENLRKETWLAMEDIYQMGKAAAIGVSNFEENHIEEIMEIGRTAPMVNQIEAHPFYSREDLIDYCQENDIAVTNYSPLTRGKFMNHPIVRLIARDKAKTPAQVLLRWGIQHGDAVIPKSSRRDHIRENIKIFDFELDDEEMEGLDNLDTGKSIL